MPTSTILLEAPKKGIQLTYKIGVGICVALLHGLALWGLQHMAVKLASKPTAEIVIPIQILPQTLQIEQPNPILPNSPISVQSVPSVPKESSAVKIVTPVKIEKITQPDAILPVSAVNTAEAAIVIIAKSSTPQTSLPTTTPIIAAPAADSPGKAQDKPADSNVATGDAIRSTVTDYSSAGNAFPTTAAKRSGERDASKAAGTGKQVKVSPSTLGGELTDASKIYPALSKKMGEQGSVYLRFFVNIDGTAENLEVARSSGFERLDQAAQEFVKQSRYIPGSLDGVPSRLLFARTVTYTINR